jgi:hypothetical protein
MGHTVRERLSVVHLQQDVEVIAQAGETEDPDVVEPLGPSEGSEGDLLHEGSGQEEEPSVEGPVGDLEQGVLFGDVAELSHSP